jgi:hypothetical protein
MEEFPLQTETAAENEGEAEKTAHAEAAEFVEKHKDLLEHYARGRVKFLPAPEGLDTFAFNLKTDEIYVNDRFYAERGLSEERTSFAVLHETEHFLEKKQMLSEENGERKFEEYLGKLEDRGYSLLDNCVADIRENRSVVSRTNSAMGELERSLYTEDLFPETDMTSAPRHIQFAQAILREARVPGEACQVAPEVREEIENIRGIRGKKGESLMDAMTDPHTPMSVRVRLQDKFLWPICEKLREKDMEDEKKKKEDQKKEDGGKPDGKKEETDGSGKGEENGKEKKSSPGKKSEGAGKKPGEKIGPSGKPGQENGEGEPDPNDIFKEAYDKAAEKALNAVPLEEIKKALKEWQEAKKDDPLDAADKEYADKLGVKKEDLKRYRDIVTSLEKTVDPETGENAIEELRKVFERIISSRLKPAPLPRYPVEEGEDLVHPADLVASSKAGNFEPKVWETFEIREKTGSKIGEVEITVVCDRSSSMTEGSKLAEQRKAVALAMEALKEFGERCDEERVNMDAPLQVRSEVYAFQATAADRVPLKKMSPELNEKERVEVSAAVSSAPGDDTTDYETLDAISKNLSPEVEKKIHEGELKKIVIVFTDGRSGNAAQVQEHLKNLRQKGVIVVGVGITEAGRPALETYAPEGRLAETAEKLVWVLKDILKVHLRDI